MTNEKDSLCDEPTGRSAVVSCRRADHAFDAQSRFLGLESCSEVWRLIHPSLIKLTGLGVEYVTPNGELTQDLPLFRPWTDSGVLQDAKKAIASIFVTVAEDKHPVVIVFKKAQCSQIYIGNPQDDKVRKVGDRKITMEQAILAVPHSVLHQTR